ncbi:MAG: DNA topoisomerase III [Defluviitaleaceae bacterium]|nr:DNA topoisomerase III [Defluviitaleaceae bacterium]
MSKILVIAEKPSVARDIARVVGANTKGDGVLSGGKYIISWAIGHLLTLCDPDDYDPALKKWTVQSLPIIPAQIRTKPIKKTAAQLRILTRLMKDATISNIICATDSGREGELIFRYIYNHAKCKKPVQRLWISSMTDEAIRIGLENMRPAADFDNLYNSALCRSHADWLVGINASRAYSLRHNANLSIGRVQTPTLAMIVARQTEIDNFTPTNYWEIHATFAAQNDNYSSRHCGTDPQSHPFRIPTAEIADEIIKKVKNQPAKITSIETNKKSTPPQLLQDLAELQREANRRFGYSATKTLQIAQDLYEKRKLITYPRTDSRHLSPDINLNAVITGLTRNPAYAQYATHLQTLEKLPITKRIIDAGKVTDHHAIIPTNKTASTGLSADEAKIYDLIVRRFLAAFYPAYIEDITEAITAVAGEDFVSKGIVIVQMGWKELYNTENEENKENLPMLHKNDAVQMTDIKSIAKKTQPPKPYTEATLLSAMENAGKAVDDEEIAAHMKQNGLGTAATRAAIIERLLAVGYIIRKGKALQPTDKGKTLIQILPTEITSAETTGRWEKGLHRINDGAMNPERFMGSIEKFVYYLVDNATKSDTNTSITFPQDDRKMTKGKRKATNGSLGKCPYCNSDVLENTKSYYCAKWKSGCKFTIWKSETARYNYKLTQQDVASILSNNPITANITMLDTHEPATAQIALDITNPTNLRLINLTRIKP